MTSLPRPYYSGPTATGGGFHCVFVNPRYSVDLFWVGPPSQMPVAKKNSQMVVFGKL